METLSLRSGCSALLNGQSPRAWQSRLSAGVRAAGKPHSVTNRNEAVASDEHRPSCTRTVMLIEHCRSVLTERRRQIARSVTSIRSGVGNTIARPRAGVRRAGCTGRYLRRQRGPARRGSAPCQGPGHLGDWREPEFLPWLRRNSRAVSEPVKAHGASPVRDIPDLPSCRSRTAREAQQPGRNNRILRERPRLRTVTTRC